MSVYDAVTADLKRTGSRNTPVDAKLATAFAKKPHLPKRISRNKRPALFRRPATWASFVFLDFHKQRNKIKSVNSFYNLWI
jgi:hypothetical protein